ncbi:MAG: hypothetical protein DME18_12395 [Verrucomicrobia bacterium]|nr:MAG: hypothetical protein DME18_12395 [Verrucomicrobiota bacterium]
MQSEDGFALTLALSPAGTIQLDWVAQPTWLCSAATCRRVWSVAGAHRSVLPESGGLVARRHGQVARATLIFTESFRPRRGNAQSPRWEKSLNGGHFAKLRKFLPAHEPPHPSLSPTGGEGGRRPGEGAFRGSRAQGARKVRGISLPGGEGRGEGERLITLNSYDLVVSEAI